MTDLSKNVHVVCADRELARRYARELKRSLRLSDIALLPSASEARRNAERPSPIACLLDESAVGPGESMESISAALCERAPLVVIASAERQAELDSLMPSGRLDFVPRGGDFIQVAVGLLERRARDANLSRDVGPESPEAAENFGEVLRHEVNNPLTGILGNAELLLARREGLPPIAIERLETIAELAVRLRETVRRISDDWDENQQERACAGRWDSIRLQAARNAR